MEFKFVTPVTISQAVFERVNTKTVKFAEDLGLRYSSELSKITMMVYPYLDEHQLYYCNLVHMFLWLLDDQLDCTTSPREQKGQLMAKTFNVLDGKDVDELGLIGLLKFILNEAQCRGMEKYLSEQIRDYVEGVNEHMATNDKMLTVDEFFNIRLRDGACEVVWPLMLLDQHSFGLYEEYLQSVDGSRIRRLANLNVAIVNDIYSIKKDRKDGTNFNSVFCYMAEHKTTEEEAVDELIKRSNAYYEEIEMAKQTSPIAETVATRLLQWCKGSAYWHQLAARYHANL